MAWPVDLLPPLPAIWSQFYLNQFRLFFTDKKDVRVKHKFTNAGSKNSFLVPYLLKLLY
jgi:hypothetical protein